MSDPSRVYVWDNFSEHHTYTTLGMSFWDIPHSDGHLSRNSTWDVRLVSRKYVSTSSSSGRSKRSHYLDVGFCFVFLELRRKTLKWGRRQPEQGFGSMVAAKIIPKPAEMSNYTLIPEGLYAGRMFQIRNRFPGRRPPGLHLCRLTFQVDLTA